MNDYIGREAAAKVLCDACGNAACPKGLIPRCSYYERMQKIPAADVRPVVRGTWVRDEKRFGDNEVRCSQCGALLEGDDLKWRNNYYCFHCGAEMREDGGENHE